MEKLTNQLVNKIDDSLIMLLQFGNSITYITASTTKGVDAEGLDS